VSARSIFETELAVIETAELLNRDAFETQFLKPGKPVLIKGMVKDWPAVQAAQASTDSLAKYLLDMGSQTPARAFISRPEEKGRYFYNPDMTGFNFERRDIPYTALFEKLLAMQDDENPIGIYAGAAPSSENFPDFKFTNKMPLLDSSADPKIWIGNSARVAPHFDMSDNIACLISGKRRFVLFPPEQVRNLYVGPIDFNMAGQPASMVDPVRYDPSVNPKFEEAVSHALVAKMEPGNAIYIPSLWWHYVESKGPFNTLVNYWWDEFENGSPINAMALALLLLREMPNHKKASWRTLFDHYVFDEDAGSSAAHIPAHAKGVLGPKSVQRDERIKTFLRSQLSQALR